MSRRRRALADQEDHPDCQEQPQNQPILCTCTTEYSCPMSDMICRSSQMIDRRERLLTHAIIFAIYIRDQSWPNVISCFVDLMNPSKTKFFLDVAISVYFDKVREKDLIYYLNS
jgi:hypothetical protein